MPSFDDNTCLFVVRIWVERREIENAPAVVRGVVEHVLSGERHYLKSLDQIASFIALYLQDLGVDVGSPSKFRQWLNNWKHLLKSQE